MSARFPGDFYRGPLTAVIFDWAGTVVDFGSRAPVAAVLQTFVEFDVPLSVDEARGPMGMAKREHLQALLALPRVANQWRQVHGQAPNGETVDRVYQAFLATQSRVIADSGQLIPGCLATLEGCRQRGLKLGSSTGYTKELMELLVPVAQKQGLQFDAMVCADDVPRGRPAPWMCLENAKRLGVFPMASIVAVDDTTVGIEAGLNAGMWTVGVLHSGNLVGLSESELEALNQLERASRIDAASQKLVGAGAHFVIPTIAELPAVLDQIEVAHRLGGIS